MLKILYVISITLNIVLLVFILGISRTSPDMAVPKTPPPITAEVAEPSIAEQEVLPPKMDTHTLLVDLYRGSINQTLKSHIERSGFQIRKSDTPVLETSLQSVGILWIATDSGHEYQPDEIKAISTFVKNGGTLICSGQAWAWGGDKKDISTFPLNQLGKELGFRITGLNIGKPVVKESSIYLSGIESLTHTDWWPSKIEPHVRDFQVLIRDQAEMPMAIFIPCGKGRIFVFGHSTLLSDNPSIVLNILNDTYEPWRNDWQILVRDTQTGDGKVSTSYEGAWRPDDMTPDKYGNRPHYEAVGVHMGILELHPVSPTEPAKLKFKGVISSQTPVLAVVAGGSIHGDCLLQAYVNGTKIKEYVLNGLKWTTCTFDLTAYSGHAMELQLWATPGGERNWSYENCFIDDISFRK